MKIIDAGEVPPGEPPPFFDKGDAAKDVGESVDFYVRPDPAATLAIDYNDWHWQMRNRIRTLNDLVEYFDLTKIPAGLDLVMARFPAAITPYYASLIRELNDNDPIFRMAIPENRELKDPAFLMDDPLEEDHDMVVPGLVHRYPDRALLIATTVCAMYCRYCTRKRVAGQRETTITDASLAVIVKYLQSHEKIQDVIISGGDPLTLATGSLEKILKAVRAVPSVRLIRIGTRVPVTMPMRITKRLTTMLQRYHPLWVNTHFNHPVEMTLEAVKACARLADAGIPLGNQSVLLRGVNDDPLVMEQLCRLLVSNRIRPYYLYQCDLVRGVEHFRTPITRGVEIMEYLRGRLSGRAIPTYVVDAPHGGGKIPLLPNYVISQSPTHTVLRNYEGMLVSYPEVGADEWRMPATANASMESVADAARGAITRLGPVTSDRYKRRENGGNNEK